MNKVIKYIVICFLVLLSCSKSKDDVSQSLDRYTEGRVIETGAVIACAASAKNTDDILVFYYPEPGASRIKFYETFDVDVDKNDFKNYTEKALKPEPFFNGYLGKFTEKGVNEKWIIITFELEGEIKISNPIRTKQISKPTVWSSEVLIDQSQSGMPKFMWQDNPEGDNAIYFQVVSDEKNNLLSGTYTNENNFQYYNTSNVVLNITMGLPPDLDLNKNYNFTLMDVSLDNWVNWVAQKMFVIK